MSLHEIIKELQHLESSLKKEKLRQNYLFYISPIKNIAKRNKIIRALYGRKEKAITTKGLINELNGKKISPNVFIVSSDSEVQISNLLKEEKIKFSKEKIWLSN
jgi:hypothetical protein